MAVSTATVSFLNGERAVVVLVVARILFSLPSSLLFHGVSLSLLLLAALFLEIRAEISSSLPTVFNARPGASSGILLGAVALPAVMLSKLILLRRAYLLHEIEPEELEHITMQYWATSASCCGVLIFLWIILWRESRNVHPSSSRGIWEPKFSLSCILLYAALCLVSLATISHTGLNAALKWLWILFHGFASVKLIQHLLCTFPYCASIGLSSFNFFPFKDEAKDKEQPTSADYIPVQPFLYKYDVRSEISIIIQGVLLGLLLVPLVFKFVLHVYRRSFGKSCSERGTDNEIVKSLIFFSSLGFILLTIVPSWMQFVQDFNQHPLLWVITFVFSEPFKRLSLCVYWVCLIYASVLRFYNISRKSKMERILLRKYYHLMAVLMFLPALIFQPKFLDLAFGAALAVFLVLEIIRVWRIWPLGEIIHQFMNAFTDPRDSCLMLGIHFSLLLGCALPIWMSFGFNDRPLSPFAGVLSLGIGDTMASMVGHKYGVLRWSKTGKKTVEGTAAGITSVLAACSLLLPLLASTGYILTQDWLSLLLAVTASGMLEAYTAQLDNAFIPLVFYSLLVL
ncbi:dolichol kinase EVAN [Carica papaya]|uniref:dolichol kinase EVAN n=1 Tax=Carica papaya TaxID=3649 RepID=UPI000B8CC38F|nr:dolichol kinase EVAN [Carica papaya]